MQLDADKEIAERALNLLKTLNISSREQALRELHALTLIMGNTRVEEKDRAKAWLAVCALCEALKPDREKCSDITTLHQAAIRKTEAWLVSFG